VSLLHVGQYNTFLINVIYLSFTLHLSHIATYELTPGCFGIVRPQKSHIILVYSPHICNTFH